MHDYRQQASQYPPRGSWQSAAVQTSTSLSTFSSGSSTGFSAPSSTGFGGKPTVNSSTSASFNQGPRSNINSTVRHAPDKRVYSTQKTGNLLVAEIRTTFCTKNILPSVY